MGRTRNSDKTKKYKLKTAKASNRKNSTTRRGKEKSKHPKLKKAVRIGLIVFALLMLIGIGVFAGIFFSDKWKITREDLAIAYHNTVVYDADEKEIGELTGEENRKIISMSEMGEYIPNAFVAIEDERFYKHHGVDIKRTIGATASYIIHAGKSSYGGSTITQQLVKNLMEDKADSGFAGIERKIREWSRAYQIEKMLSKSQILELYLNKIFMGGTVYGVESASQYYFDKSAKKLSLAQAAFLAGINHSPNSYNPFGDDDNDDIIKSRTKTVLAKMLELSDMTGITQEQYDKAVAEVDKGLKFKQGSVSNTTNISFHTAAAIDQVAKDLAEEKDLSYDAARTMVFNGGYKLYTTQVNSIQDRMEEEYEKSKYIKSATTKKGKEEDQHSQSAMVIIDYKTGQVVGTVGGLGEDSSTLGLNRATQSYRQAGSSIKPLASIAPGLENGVITAATVYDDSPTSFGGISYNNSTGYQGLCTVRKGIEVSSNIVNMKILSNVGPSNSIKMLNAMGLDAFDGSDEMLTLALGGSTHGATPLQMAAAYAMIANGGEYITPTFYTRLESATGTKVVEAKQETKRVMSEGNAYVLANILKAPVTGSSGTATSCRISGMEVGAKTGTTSDYKDKWLCGITPYYAAATWFGYDEPEGVYGIAGTDNPARSIWAAVMKDIHADLESADFEKPSNIVTAKICKDSGRVATKQCTRTYTEVFVSGTVPTECDGHKTVEVCTESKKLATEYCPKTKKTTYVSKPEKEVNPTWKTKEGSKYKEITETCTIHTEKTMSVVVQNVVGKTQSAAKSALSGLKVQIAYGDDPTKANGIVLKQSINPGETVKKDTTIVLTINKTAGLPEPPSGGNTGDGEEQGGSGTTNTEVPSGGDETNDNTMSNTEASTE